MFESLRRVLSGHQPVHHFVWWNWEKGCHSCLVKINHVIGNTEQLETWLWFTNSGLSKFHTYTLPHKVLQYSPRKNSSNLKTSTSFVIVTDIKDRVEIIHLADMTSIILTMHNVSMWYVADVFYIVNYEKNLLWVIMPWWSKNGKYFYFHHIVTLTLFVSYSFML